jgi:hypothetical protein
MVVVVVAQLVDPLLEGLGGHRDDASDAVRREIRASLWKISCTRD